MNIDNLVQMANAIGLFFESMPDRDEAIDGVANHLRRYWEPRMRRQLLEAADRTGTPVLHPLLSAAIRERRGWLLPSGSTV